MVTPRLCLICKQKQKLDMFNLIKTRILYQFDHNYRAQKHKNSPNSQNNKMNLFTKLKVEFDKKNVVTFVASLT